MMNARKRSRRNSSSARCKAACIVLAEIQAHVQNILQAFNGPDAGWPPVMTAERSHFPSITEIDIEAGAFPGTRSEKIKFILESRHDNVQDRRLYHARLVSPTSSDERMHVKFSQRYSVELYRFCVERGLAPRILGFQELHVRGGSGGDQYEEPQ